MMDVVIPHGTGSRWDCNELRYSLRSMEMYMGGMGKVFVVGHKPEWLQNVIHIDHEDKYGRNKGANIISKIIAACKHPDLSDKFIFKSDDHYFINHIDADQISSYYLDNLKGSLFLSGDKKWNECLRRVREELTERGFPCFNYEAHTPKEMDKKAFVEIMSMYEWEDKEFPTHSLYFNTYNKKHHKVPYGFKSFYGRQKSDFAFMGKKVFMAHNDLALSQELMDIIQRMYPKKSRFEK